MLEKKAHGILLMLLLGSMLFPAIVTVEGETEMHDLEVSLETPNLKARHHLSSGGSAILNVTVVNNGNVTEDDVNLWFLINGTIYLSSTAQKLLPNHAFWTAYLWAPEDGIWNLTAYAPPVAGEDNVLNNLVSRLVNVCADEPPIVNWTYLPPPPSPGPIKNEDVTFDASASYDPDWGNITIYSWNFNGTIKNVTDPVTTYQFTKHGNATVTLTPYDTESKNNSTSKQLTIYARPVADFSLSDEPYVDYTLTFNGTESKDDDGYITKYFWDFDDGSNGTGPIINHTYTSPGAYYPKLTVTDNDNITSFPKTKYTYVYSGYPKADFEITAPRSLPGPYYVDETLTFDASKSKADGGTITSYSWIWDDGTTNVTFPPDKVINHTFTEPKTYYVMLTVKDSDNKIGSIIKIVTVNRRVLLEVINSTGGKIVTANPLSGTFNISINITNIVDLDYFEFTLKYPAGEPPPLLRGEKIDRGDFTLDEKTIADLQGQIRVNSTAHIGGETGNFTLAIVTFSVTNPGNCTLYLSRWKLTNSTGGEIIAFATPADFYTRKPVANFTWPEPPVVNTNATFDASSSYDPDGGTIKNYFWVWNDSTTTNTTDPVTNHTYTYIPDSGYFNVTLTVTDDEGDTWNITKPVPVFSPRDVAVIDVKPSRNETAWTLHINVTVKNKGEELPETFNVTVYVCHIATGNMTEIGDWRVENLAPNNQTTKTFTWEISGFAKGNYTISANATVVPGESNTTDNTFVDGIVKVRYPGDVNDDFICDVEDYQLVKIAVPSRPSSEKWNPDADLNDDGIIDAQDYQIVKSLIGK